MGEAMAPFPSACPRTAMCWAAGTREEPGTAGVVRHVPGNLHGASREPRKAGLFQGGAAFCKREHLNALTVSSGSKGSTLHGAQKHPIGTQ